MRSPGKPDFCKANHTRSRGLPEPKKIPGFRLIDCLTRKVIARHAILAYVALSYVWSLPNRAATKRPSRGSGQLGRAELVVEDQCSYQYSISVLGRIDIDIEYSTVLAWCRT